MLAIVQGAYTAVDDCQSIPPAEQLEDLQEEVDDIQVQIHRCPDVLVQIILLDQHPGVKDNVAAEEQCTKQRKDGAAVASQALVNRDPTHAEACMQKPGI